MLRGLGGTGETEDAGSVDGPGTWPTTAGGWRLKKKESREGGCRRIGGTC